MTTMTQTFVVEVTDVTGQFPVTAEKVKGALEKDNIMATYYVNVVEK